MKYKIKDIIEEKDKKVWVSFYENPLYPDGKGGQLGDRGYISNIPILMVKEKDSEIWVLLEKRPEGNECEISINQERRRDIAIQHTAQHILSASFVKIGDIPTVSFHMGEEYSTIDLGASNISEKMVEEVVQLSNSTIRSCTRVVEKILPYEEAISLPLRRKLSDKLKDKDKIRIIEIPGFDIAACGGFHVKNTGEIGVLTIIQKEHIKGKLTRIYFIAGKRTDRYILNLTDIAHTLSSLFKVPYQELPQRGKKLLEELKNQKTELTKIGAEFAKFIEKELPKEKIGNYTIRYYEGPGYIITHLSKIAQEQDILILKEDKKYILISKILPTGQIIKILREKYPDIKGGGGKVQGNFIGEISMDKVLHEVKLIVENQL